MKTLADAWTIAKMKSVPDLKRNPFTILILLLLTGGIPLTFIYMFGGTGNLAGGLVGAFVSSAPVLALFAGAQDINFDNFTKLRQIFVSKPIRPVSYVIGASLSSLLYSAPGMILFGVLMLQRGLFTPTVALLSTGAMLLGWLVVSSMGFILAGYLINASPYSMNSIINLFAFGMAYIAPVYYPAKALGSFAWVSAFIPVSAAANLVRTLGDLAPADGLTVLSLAVLVVEGFLFTVVFVARSKWRED